MFKRHRYPRHPGWVERMVALSDEAGVETLGKLAVVEGKRTRDVLDAAWG